MAPSIEWLFPTPLYWNKINDQRAKIKRNINESFDSNIKEIKKYTNY